MSGFGSGIHLRVWVGFDFVGFGLFPLGFRVPDFITNTQGVMDFDELFQNIESANCQFEYTWSLVGLFSFVSSRLDHFDTFIKLSARAELAFMAKYDSKLVQFL